ncbi:BCCT family transporter [Stutzerimonas stutzeri]|uniref:BCCT family transporter n=1 Tax=Stutzerimonas stutzeri TaxID=316 RepID=UPI000AD6AF47|nr:BCCT family transporter [Stutzerimonas stutzeri]
MFLLGIVQLAIFFITSSGSGSLIIETITSGARTTALPKRVFWCISEGLVAIGLLLGSGPKPTIRQLPRS